MKEVELIENIFFENTILIKLQTRHVFAMELVFLRKKWKKNEIQAC